jgi:hypothetical protein
MNKAQIILHYLGHGDSHSSHSCAAAENILLMCNSSYILNRIFSNLCMLLYGNPYGNWHIVVAT